MELQVQGLESLEAVKIHSNFAEVRKYLADELLAYKGLIVTPDSVAVAKTTRANIRKIATRIDDQRKAVKNAYLVPYNLFEAEMKELKGMCDEVVSNIDTQVKAYDEQAKAEREARLRSLFEDKAGDLLTDGICTWEQIFNPRWVNVSYGETKAADELVRAIARLRSEVNAIRTLDAEFVPALLDEYARNHDFPRVMMLKATLEKRKAAEAERAKSQAQEQPIQQPAEQPKRAVEAETAEPVTQEQPLWDISFRVIGTPEQFSRIKAFFKANGIKYTKI